MLKSLTNGLHPLIDLVIALRGVHPKAMIQNFFCAGAPHSAICANEELKTPQTSNNSGMNNCVNLQCLFPTLPTPG